MAIRAILVAIIAFLAMPASASAADRVALVIGNSAYKHASVLRNPGNDSTDIASALEGLEFEVTLANDLGFDALRRTLRDFSRAASNARMAIVFYAGHGMEVSNQNYLVPVDAQLETDNDITYEAVPLELVTEAVSGAKELKLVVLDACRNNPFQASMKMTNPNRSIGRGFARIEPEPGTLVAYAAREGTVADDGEGRNSPFTAALLAHLDEPGLEINFLFRRVRDSVLEQTNNRQMPFTYGSLPGREIYLLDKPAGEETPPQAAATAKPADNAAQSLELALWNEVRQSDDAALIRAYLDQFPDGVFSGVAKLKLRQVESGTAIAALPDKADNNESRQTLAGQREITQCDRLAAIKEDTLPGVEGVEYIERANQQAAISACRSALRDYPDDARLNYQLGRALETAGEHRQAVVAYRRAVELGSAPAMSNLGYAYENGNGVEKDLAEAARLYRRSAEGGYVLGEYNYAIALANAIGIPQDDREAVKWYRKAAEKGDSDAQLNLGFMYENGRGLPVDEGEAVKWYRLAAEQGNARGQNNLGVMYEHGRGVKADITEATYWYEQSAKQDFPDGMHNLGVRYEVGEGKPRDDALAAQWIARALKAGAEHTYNQMTTNHTAYNAGFRREMQRILRNEGVYSGSLDGDFGAGTLTAIRQYAGR